MYRIVAFAVFMMLMVSSAQALQPREGWVIQHSQKPFDLLLADLKQAVTDNKMGLVTEAGPTAAAASRGVELPGNRVVGVFRVDFAIRILPLSEAAMIEAGRPCLIRHRHLYSPRICRKGARALLKSHRNLMRYSPGSRKRQSNSRATRSPDNEVSATSARFSRVQSSTTARIRKRRLAVN